MQQLLKRYKKYHPDPDVELIKRAYNLAELTYFGENRISGESWLDHSLAVAREVAVLRMDTATICAALLYDTYRFGLTSEELAEEVSEEVANLVDGVDALRRLTVKHRPDLKDKVYSEYLRRLVLFTSKDLRVVVLRLSEKFVGLKTLKYLDEETQNKLLDKAIHIYAPLADLIGIGMLRNGIQDRYFSFSDPKMYKESKKIIRAHPYAVPKKMTQFIKGLKEAIDNHNASIDEIFWRIKKPYSFTKKAEHYVQKYDCSYEQACNRIKDKVAITIIAPTLEQCYRSLDAIHQNFDYIPEDFDDYISNPKPNGYKSLQTTIKVEDGHFIELQIKTPKHHEFNEFGPASHVYYKLHGPSESVESGLRIDMLKRLLTWKHLILEDISGANVNDLEDTIIVFTPIGDLIELPVGSTPVDFAYEVHTNLGNTAINSIVDGKQRPLNYELKTGEVVKIKTDRNRKRPNRDWLKFVKTNRAKFCIKKHSKY